MEKVEHDSSGEISSKLIYKYDEKGNEVEWASYDAGGKIEFGNTYKYDEKGNLMERVKFGVNGIIESKHIFEYDEKGSAVKWTTSKLDTRSGKKRFFPVRELVHELTYWD